MVLNSWLSCCLLLMAMIPDLVAEEKLDPINQLAIDAHEAEQAAANKRLTVNQMVLCGANGGGWYVGKCLPLPRLQLVMGGELMMGCQDLRDTGLSAPACKLEEQPPHRVTIQPFMIGQYEVTFAEWDACTACRRIDSKGLARVTHPVTHISWQDTQTYLRWLRDVTGDAAYRLPTEAEWEYAARAGKQTAYPWGNAAACTQATYGHTHCGMDSATIVGKYQPNDLGLFDTSGNLWEWVEDCWHSSYHRAPPHAVVWSDGCINPGLGVIRGGSYVTDASGIRTVSRKQQIKTEGGHMNGFRIAKGVEAP